MGTEKEISEGLIWVELRAKLNEENDAVGLLHQVYYHVDDMVRSSIGTPISGAIMGHMLSAVVTVLRLAEVLGVELEHAVESSNAMDAIAGMLEREVLKMRKEGETPEKRTLN